MAGQWLWLRATLSNLHLRAAAGATAGTKPASSVGGSPRQMGGALGRLTDPMR